jgi:hypothetical protein
MHFKLELILREGFGMGFAEEFEMRLDDAILPDPTVSFELKMTDKVVASVADLWREGSQQPLAHELFREAAQQKSENPRSCLVLGVAAAEVGFKQLVGGLLPDAKWLADNAPSPPLVTMLKDYLPILPTKGRLNGFKPKVPATLIETLKKAVLLRNDVVHGKTPTIPREKSLQEILEAIHDCLYLFDFCNGHLWAWNLITVETQKLIVQESSGISSAPNQRKSGPRK